MRGSPQWQEWGKRPQLLCLGRGPQSCPAHVAAWNRKRAGSEVTDSPPGYLGVVGGPQLFFLVTAGAQGEAAGWAAGLASPLVYSRSQMQNRCSWWFCKP